MFTHSLSFVFILADYRNFILGFYIVFFFNLGIWHLCLNNLSTDSMLLPAAISSEWLTAPPLWPWPLTIVLFQNTLSWKFQFFRQKLTINRSRWICNYIQTIEHCFVDPNDILGTSSDDHSVRKRWLIFPVSYRPSCYMDCQLVRYVAARIMVIALFSKRGAALGEWFPAKIPLKVTCGSGTSWTTTTTLPRRLQRRQECIQRSLVQLSPSYACLYSHRSPHVGRLPAVVTLRCTLRRILHLSPGCRCIRHPTHRAPCRPMTYTRSPAPRTRTCYPLIIVDISIFLHAPISLNNSHSDVFAQSSKARISKRRPISLFRFVGW